jgi:hypothetical protein
VSETKNLKVVPESGGGGETEEKKASLADIIARAKVDPNYVPNYRIRTITGADFSKLIGMIRGTRDNEQLAGVIRAGGTQETIALGVFGALIDEVEEEVVPFVLDLAGKSVEEYRTGEASMLFDIMTDLINSESFLSVLASALRFVVAGQKLFGR